MYAILKNETQAPSAVGSVYGRRNCTNSGQFLTAHISKQSCRYLCSVIRNQ